MRPTAPARSSSRGETRSESRTGQDRTGPDRCSGPHHLGMHSSCCCSPVAAVTEVFFGMSNGRWAPLSLFRPCRQQQHWLPFNNIMKTRVLQLIRVAALLAFFRFVVHSFRCLPLSALSCCLCLPASLPVTSQVLATASRGWRSLGGRRRRQRRPPIVAPCSHARRLLRNRSHHKSQKQPNTFVHSYMHLCIYVSVCVRAYFHL